MKHLHMIVLALVVLTLSAACSPRTEPIADAEVAASESKVTESTLAPSAAPTIEPTISPTTVATGEPTVTPETTTPTVQAMEPTADNPAVVDFWTSDYQGERLAAYRNVADRYMAENPNVEVVIVPVEESTISLRLREAALGDVLPDIARVGLERLAPLLSADLVDAAAADSAINAIGREDFREGPLAMVTDAESGLATAVPFDGWIQAIWYRQDLFQEQQLESPVTWEQINVACDVFGNSDAIPYALTLPTNPELNYAHQVFEQIAMSNNAWPFDETGAVTMNTPQMTAALRFYADLQRCAPSGVQDLYDARENYELDQAAMLFYSTYIMDDLVEGSDLRDGSGTVELATEDLAAQSAFASGLVGPNGVASYGQLTVLAIMHGADPAAQDVVRYFLTEGYTEIIATAPLGKIPVLESAVQEWTTLSPIFERYSPATLGHIAAGFDNMQRWLFRPEYGARERTVIGEIEGNLLIPEVIHKITVEKSLTPETGAEWLQEQVEMLLAEQ